MPQLENRVSGSVGGNATALGVLEEDEQARIECGLGLWDAQLVEQEQWRSRDRNLAMANPPSLISKKFTCL
jgi:hypothetical protein